MRGTQAIPWIHEHQNCLNTGPTGAGKSYLACALGNKACREGAGLAGTDLLVLDNWGMSLLTDKQRRDLLEILDDRYDNRSTLVASQMPHKKWHELIGDPTVAATILDRLVLNAYKLTFKGESMRKAANGKFKETASMG